MKSEDMLKAIGDIDDELILGAEVSQDLKPVKEKKEKTVKSAVKKFDRWAGGIAAVLVLCIVGGFLGNGFRGMGTKGGAAAPMDSPQFNSGYHESYDYKNDMSYEGAMIPSKDAATAGTGVKLASEIANVKLIYRANISLQTTEYEKTLDGIKAMVAEFGGYFEGSEVYNGNYYYSGLKNGSYTIRIPSDSYRAFIDSVGDGARVVRLNESVEDIGQQYYDAESRLETLNIKLDRLQELLQKADNMSDIIVLENEISDVEYSIQKYSTTLNRYDSLIGYSTINMDIQEVNKYDGSSVQKEGFGTRLARAIKNGLMGAVETAEDFVIWVGYNLVGIIVFVALVLIIWKTHIIARIVRKIRGKQ
ncbi:MAG: DUF4349 domain-containing protein [Clostridia bacterium]|nr:DUF4349 domain-containing protein [Clostridia bacterium]